MDVNERCITGKHTQSMRLIDPDYKRVGLSMETISVYDDYTLSAKQTLGRDPTSAVNHYVHWRPSLLPLPIGDN